MPFITEELWEQARGNHDGALITGRWPDLDPALADAEAAAELDWTIRLISEVRAVRAELNVPPASKLTLGIKDAGPETKRRLASQGEIIRRLARLERIEADLTEVPAGSVQVVIDEATAILPLAGVIDLEEERGRLGREAAKLEAETAKLDKKLSNEQFLAKAPEAVVAENRARREELAEKLERVKTASERLDAL